jgi:hypothetical protein
MKHNINFIYDTFMQYDNDPQRTMFLWDHPEKKEELFTHLLHASIHGIDHLEGFECEQKHRNIITWLDNHYDAYTWPLHDIHFHTTIMKWISCPYTCLNEIVSTLEKILKENFHA